MDENTELLREIRDILLVAAEPALAKRDEKYRNVLKIIAGKSKPRAKAILLMDGSRTQAMIRTQIGIDAGEISRTVKALREASLVVLDDKQNLKLVIRIPPNFFEDV